MYTNNCLIRFVLCFVWLQQIWFDNKFEEESLSLSLIRHCSFLVSFLTRTITSIEMIQIVFHLKCWLCRSDKQIKLISGLSTDCVGFLFSSLSFTASHLSKDNLIPFVTIRWVQVIFNLNEHRGKSVVRKRIFTEVKLILTVCKLIWMTIHCEGVHFILIHKNTYTHAQETLHSR